MSSSPVGPMILPQGRVSPYLADWHQAFAARGAGPDLPVELWFDRGSWEPMVERASIPRDPDADAEELASLYLSAVINNALCLFGAKGVSIVSGEGDIPLALLAAVERNLFKRLDTFSNMSLHFLHGLVGQVFHEGFVLDSDRSRADRLRAALARRTPPPARPEEAKPRGACLSINIGQWLTGWSVTTLDGEGGFTVDGPAAVQTNDLGFKGHFEESFEALLAGIRRDLGEGASEVEAVGISVAATVVDGMVIPVPTFGLFAAGPLDGPLGINGRLRAICARYFPGRPVVVANDGKTQALYAFHYANGRELAGGPEGHVLSVRLGACPCVHCLDARGEAQAGFDEFGWLVVSRDTSPGSEKLFRTIRPYLSYYGVAVIAHELGLLEKRRVHPEKALAYFHRNLLSGDGVLRVEAESVYARMGGHAAMLACEVHRHRPVSAVMLLGSRDTLMDGAAFSVVREGFRAFLAEHAPSLAGTRFLLVPDASSRASFVGVAHLALREAWRERGAIGELEHVFQGRNNYCTFYRPRYSGARGSRRPRPYPSGEASTT